MKLSGGITRTDLPMADGRTIRYYDRGEISRTAVDPRPFEERPELGELRLDMLTDEWISVAAHRQARAFLPPKELCPLCASKPGLDSEIADTNYQVVVFDNKSPSFGIAKKVLALPEKLGRKTKVGQSIGKCEVICFTDNHDISFHELPLEQIRTVMEAWRDRTRELSKVKYIQHIAPFENRGEEIGVTLNHPHGQVYAYPFIPPKVSTMMRAAQSHFKKTGKVLLDDIVKREIKDEVRIVARNEHWIAYVPFAARYPFEIHVAPLKSVPDFTELTDVQADAFPAIAKEVLTRLDGVFGIQMAYIAAWHQAPVRKGRSTMRLHWQITSIRRAPGKLKYLAGSESAMGSFIMDMSPEQSAEQLRNVKIK